MQNYPPPGAPNYSASGMPQGQAPKSKKPWIIGGVIGCLLLIFIAVLALGGLAYFGMKKAVGLYEGYEFRFTAEKNNVNFWGRVAMLPPPSGQKKGVALVMIASDRTPGLSGVEDVGEKGELPVILDSFRFGEDGSN
jgi:hypothetical protein